MKALLALFLCALLAGCGTPAGSVQQFDLNAVLNLLLPPGYTGDLYIAHKNPRIDFTIDAGNVRRGADGKWLFDWLVFHRYGVLSHGDVVLGTPPATRPRH